MIKYTIVAYIILAFLLLYQVNQLTNVKKIVDKRVEGISTQIKELEAYQEEVSNLDNNY